MKKDTELWKWWKAFVQSFVMWVIVSCIIFAVVVLGTFLWVYPVYMGMSLWVFALVCMTIRIKQINDG